MSSAIESGVNTETKNDWKDFLKLYYERECKELVNADTPTLKVNYDNIYTFDSELADDVMMHPDIALPAGNEALSEVSQSDTAKLKVTNLPETKHIDGLSDTDMNCLTCVEGIVRKATEVRPRGTEISFECKRCGTMTTVEQNTEEFTEPHQCGGCERQGPFKLLYNMSETVPFQKIRLQKPPEDAEATDPPEMTVYVEEYETGKVSPGDRVTVTGKVKPKPKDDTPVFIFEQDAHYVRVEDKAFEDMDISNEELEKIQEISERDDLYEALTDSLAPSIMGYDTIKLAILLQLFSGVTKDKMPGGRRLRGDTHILIVGDPGTGKSELMGAAKELAPRSVKVSGEEGSSAGLTAAAVQDDFGDGKWTLEAGALVLADKGMVLIDELDKMSEDDTESLHEALEQQEVNIAKAGINSTLPTRTSLLAAGNPERSRFDRQADLMEQIDLQSSLISRFDLIYKVMDEADEQKDEKLSKHIMDSHIVGERLEANKEVDTDHAEPEIPTDILRKYIAHSRATCVPQIEKGGDAYERLSEFYVDLRAGDELPTEEGTVAVTPRQIEGLVRLAEASARARLSDTVTEEDAERAISLVKESLGQTHFDPERGIMDADRQMASTDATQRDIVDAAEENAKSFEKITKDTLVERVADQVGCTETRAENEVTNLIRRGVLLVGNDGESITGVR